MDPLAQRRAALHRQISAAQLQLDALELVPVEDVYPDGTIIKATILNPGKRDPLTYVFLKVKNQRYEYGASNPSRWYHTGWVQHSPGASRGNTYQLTYFNGWGDLQRWLTEPGRVIETWEPMVVAHEIRLKAELPVEG